MVLTDDAKVSIHLERVSKEYRGEASQNKDTLEVMCMHMWNSEREEREERGMGEKRAKLDSHPARRRRIRIERHFLHSPALLHVRFPCNPNT